MLENIRKRDRKSVIILSVVTVLSLMCCIVLIMATAQKPDSPEHCARCHEGDDDRHFNADTQRKDSLSWTVSFRHSQHSEQDLSCKECHLVSRENDTGIVEYNLNCSKCHHTTPELDCVKCHKDDLDRFINTDPQRRDSLSWTVSFRHSQHPVKDLACKECHSISHENDDGIVEYSLNCSECHHVSEEMTECIECHKEPSEYLRGESGVDGIKSVPDMMCRAVKCEDCHKYDGEGLKFKGVKEHCIECHNDDYGKLYNAWTGTIKDRLRKLNYRIQSLNEESGFLYENESDVDMEKTGQTIDSITKYGTHNFNLTRILLDDLEDKIEK